MAIREPGTGKKTRRKMGKQAIRIAALEAQLAQYRWRRVEEERPMEGLRVLAYPADDIAVVTLRYDTEGREYWEDDYMTQMWPTHWMPLPPAPGEVE